MSCAFTHFVAVLPKHSKSSYTAIQPDDHVILFLADRRHIEAVERLFLGAPPR
jgi:hypothetical protein